MHSVVFPSAHDGKIIPEWWRKSTTFFCYFVLDSGGWFLIYWWAGIHTFSSTNFLILTQSIFLFCGVISVSV
jgi:hypothetical protein